MTAATPVSPRDDLDRKIQQAYEQNRKRIEEVKKEPTIWELVKAYWELFKAA